LGLLPFASLPTVLHSRLVMKENFVMSHPILGYTILQDFNISVNFATRTVLTNNIVVMSQFIDQDNVQTKQISSLIESVYSVLDSPQCHSMLLYIASKFSYVHSWLVHSAQFASSSGFSLEMEPDLVINNTLPCSMRMYMRHGEIFSNSMDELKRIHPQTRAE
jgi:hypothetical protein